MNPTGIVHDVLDMYMKVHHIIKKSEIDWVSQKDAP